MQQPDKLNEQLTDRIKQVKYLAQLCNISPDYAQGVYNLLSDPEFSMSQVQERAETAHLWYKEEKFRPALGGHPSGQPPTLQVYQ